MPYYEVGGHHGCILSPHGEANGLFSVASSVKQILPTHAMNGRSGRGKDSHSGRGERERGREGGRRRGGRRRGGGTMPNKVRILHFRRTETVFISCLF